MENSPEITSNPISKGCGINSFINIHVNPTTGGDFHLIIDSTSTVDNLKKVISKRLKIPRDKICLLFRDKQLLNGDLFQYGIADGSKITLLPNVETGLSNQRPEIGIMQALESLNDTQVNEFLCGKAPLNLSMRLGDHVMLIQLQLSNVGSTNRSSSNARTSIPVLQTPGPPSLLQASKNLQHTLRKLSADIFARKDKSKVRGIRRENIYSGTFSSALSPKLQDSRGKPRRGMATIVHILNDLLCSVPELKRYRNSEPSTSSSSSFTSLINKDVGAPNTSNNVETESSSSSSTISSNSNKPCDSSSSICDTLSEEEHLQNTLTRNKLDQLRLVMEEKRERRKQRKQKPYTLSQHNDTDTVTAS